MTMLLACPKCRGLYRSGAEHCVFDGRPLHVADADPWLGTVVGGSILDAVVADGERARVYRARPRSGGAPVAVKLLYAERAAIPAEESRFWRELELTRRLRHPHLLTALDVGHLGPLPYLVTEMLPGTTLDAFLAARGPLKPSMVLPIFSQVCDAVAALHRVGVLHRDLGTKRVLVSLDGQSAAIFGLARGSRRCTRGVPHTVPMLRLGSTGDADTGEVEAQSDERVDLDGLGAILAAMVGQSVDCAAVRRLTSDEPGERYQSASEVLEDLRRASLTPPPG